MKKAVVYARFSSHKQGEQSIEGQLAAAYKYASENGYKIIHEYIDRAMTGRNDNREQFQQMLKDTAKKQFDTILIWKIDRFGRNREEIAFNKYRCKKNGVKVAYVAESIPDSPEGVILESVLEGMAEYYSLQLAQNVRRGQRMSAEKCKYVGGSVPLGYVIDHATKKYVVDEKHAPTAKLAFSMYAAGHTVSEVVGELNRKGLRNRQGKPFTQNSLYSMLKNEKYTGVYTYKDEIKIEGGIPALINKELFLKVQKMLRKNKKSPSHSWHRDDYLLTDKLFCGKCGSKMVGESGTGKSGQKYNYYTCFKRKKEHACGKKNVPRDVLEAEVLNAIRKILFDDKLINFIADAVWAYYLKDQKDDDLKNSLEIKLAEIQKSTDNILKAIEAGIFNDTTKKRMDELEAQRSEIESELAGIQLQQAVQITRDYVLFYLTELRKGDFKDLKFQKHLIDVFVNAIFLYDDGRATLTFNYSGDDQTVTLEDLENAERDGVKCSDFMRQCAPQHTRPNTFVIIWRNVFIVYSAMNLA